MASLQPTPVPSQHEIRLPRTWAYSIAVLSVALTSVIRIVVDPFVGREQELLLFVFLGAVFVSAWRGGLEPGLAATGLSVVAVVAPHYDDIPQGEWIRLLLFSAVAVLISWLLEVRIITEQSRLELLERERQARAETEEKARELARSNADLERFAFAASHDLQEPLRMIASFAQLLSRRYKGKLDKDADEFLDYINDGTNRMREMIQGILGFSRVIHSKEEPVPVNLNESLEKAKSNIRASIEETQARIEPSTLPTVSGVPIQLVQVFQNLLSNAIRYRGEEPPVIRVSAERRSREWVVSVSDNGVGIDPAYHEQIFYPFKRLSREKGGTGMGLALCQRIVEGHGGRIWVESKPGEGSTFRFTLPAA